MRGVQPWEVDLLWPEYLPLVEKALAEAHGEFTAEDIHKSLIQKKMQLWASEKKGRPQAVAVTEIYSYPNKKICQIVLAATNMHMGPDFWREMIIPVKAWAKKRGCQSVRAQGRPGWERVMGWQKIYTVIEEEL